MGSQVSALKAKLLSVASPKESKQRKGEPIALCVWLAAGFFACCRACACRGPYFSLLRQRKGEQKKGEPKAVPLRGALRYSRRAGSGANSLRSNSARPDPVAAALLSTAYGSGGPRVLVRCAHLAHACWRATRGAGAAAAAAPSAHPFTTTAPFPNRGKQTRIATFRVNTPIRPEKTKLGIQAPLHPPRG